MLWRKVLEADPKNVGAWVQLGNMLNEQQRRDEAIAAFSEAGAIDPDLAHVPAGIAGVHERVGRWEEAERYWLDAATLLERYEGAAGKQISKELAHAYSHGALAARRGGAPNRAFAILQRAKALSTHFNTDPGNWPLRMSLLPLDDLNAAGELIDDLLAAVPVEDARAVRDLPGYAERDIRSMLIAMAPLFDLSCQGADFTEILAELFRQAKLLRELQSIMERAYLLHPERPDYLTNAIDAAVARQSITDARRLARLSVQKTGEFAALHVLMNAQEEAGETDNARLLCRFLVRRWPHSRWHVSHYITLTAKTRSLGAADRIVRRELLAGRYDEDIERAYCRSAFFAAHYDEAKKRIENSFRVRDEEEMQALLGYTIANVEGISEAEQFFANMAARSVQSLGGMLGVVHMRLRRRDFAAAHDQWLRIAALHPGETAATVELARCMYELRDNVGALEVCRASLATAPDDVTMSEFYAWLLTVNGAYAEAQKEIERVRELAGQSWAMLELAIRCASELRQLDERWPAILTLVPAVDSGGASSRLYHAVRSLVVAERVDLIASLLSRSSIDPSRLGWLEPYRVDVARDIGRHDPENIRSAWASTRKLIGNKASDLLDRMSDLEVQRLLERPRTAQPIVHVINKFEQPRGGSELHALDLATEIGRYAPVDIWAPEQPHPHFAVENMVTGIDVGRSRFPRGGTIVMVGVYFEIAWLRFCRPGRVIFLYNTFEAPDLHRQVLLVEKLTGVHAELLFCSDIMQAESGFPGRFEPSPTDLVAFGPASAPRPAERPFTLGRHSRDVFEKHNADDWRVYQEVSRVGGVSQILGGSCMKVAYPAIPGLSLLPARNTGIPEFLRSLDAYYYRTSTWIEPWGRVVIEAMACSLPVLVHSVGGYAQIIEHEVNGLLFDHTDKAVRLVRRLIEEPAWRRRMGEAARETVENLLSPAAMRRLVAFYLVN